MREALDVCLHVHADTRPSTDVFCAIWFDVQIQTPRAAGAV